MNAGVGLISFPKNTFNETFANKTVSADNIINLVKTLMEDFDGDEDDSVACPWYEIGQEPIVLANQQVKDGSKMPVEVLFMKMNGKMIFQYRIFFHLVLLKYKITSMYSFYKVHYNTFFEKKKTENNL